MEVNSPTTQCGQGQGGGATLVSADERSIWQSSSDSFAWLLDDFDNVTEDDALALKTLSPVRLRRFMQMQLLNLNVCIKNNSNSS